MKQFPNLTLVTREDPESGSEGQLSAEHGLRSRFDLLGLDELSSSDQARIEQIVTELFPKASVIAVARNNRAWDLRPVVARVGDSEPSIVRFASPEIHRAQHLAARLKETLERLRSFRELSSAVLGWGVWSGELWYRRPLVERTLAHILSASDPLPVEQGLQLTHALVEEVVRWHERGVVHGHITSSNVLIRANSKIALADPAIGLCAMQALKGVTDYPLQSFAPETIGNQHAVFSADLYGLGLVFRRLFVVMTRSQQIDDRRAELGKILSPFGDLAESLLESDPARRPPLAQLRRTVLKTLEQFSQIEKKVKPKGRPPIGVQGKILRSGSGETPAPEQEAAAPIPAAPRPRRDREAEPRREQLRGPEKQARESLPEPQENLEESRPVVRDERRETIAVNPVPAPPPAPEGQYVNQPIFVQPVYTTQAYGVPPQFVTHPYPAYDPRAPHAAQATVNPYAPTQIAPPNYGPPPHASGLGSGPRMNAQLPWNWIIACSVLLFGFWYYRAHGLESGSQSQREDLQNYREDWSSRIPSRMVPVAIAAVSPEGNSAAESVILASIRSADVSNAGVNVGLLRIAFDDRWEMELSPTDRRTALALGLGTLLRQNFPKDLADLDRLHPGVLLALTASVGQISANDFFRNVPAERLVQLPPPFGPAFRELVSSRPGVRCDDEAVQRLARLGARGVNLDDLALFLREEPSLRLRALALMLSQDNSRAQTALELLLKDSNLNISDPYINWGRAFHLDQWSELEPSDRLFTLAGMPPAGKLSAESLGRLISHPSPTMRAFALRGALTSIRMKHPGALEALSALQKNPTLLSAEQTVDLVKFLINPASQKAETVRAWFEGNPPQDLTSRLLLATAEEPAGTIFDTSLAVYLKGKNWKPAIDMLRKLSFHPDAYTRLFSYSEIYLLEDRVVASEFLRDAQKREQDPENRQQLEQMLLDVTH